VSDLKVALRSIRSLKKNWTAIGTVDFHEICVGRFRVFFQKKLRERWTFAGTAEERSSPHIFEEMFEF